MSKFCARCGNILADDALFCTKCGSAQQPPVQPMNQPPINQTPVAPNGYMPQQPPMAQGGYIPVNQPPMPQNGYMSQQPTMPQAEPTQPAKKSNKPLIIGIIIALIVALTVVTILLVTQSSSSGKSSHSGGSSSSSGSGSSGAKPVTAESVVRECMEAIRNGDAETFVNCCWDAMFHDDFDKDDYIEMFEDQFDEMRLEYFEYEIESVDDLDKDDIEELEEMFDYIEAEYDNGFDADKVTDYKKVKVHISCESYYGDYSGTEEVIIIKYKGQWKIFEIYDNRQPKPENIRVPWSNVALFFCKKTVQYVNKTCQNSAFIFKLEDLWDDHW